MRTSKGIISILESIESCATTEENLEIIKQYELAIQRKPRKGYFCIGWWKGKRMWVTPQMFRRLQVTTRKFLDGDLFYDSIK